MSYSSVVQGISGLVEYWRLGELSGTTLVATVGDSNAGAWNTWLPSPTLGVTGLIANDTDTAVLFDKTQNHGAYAPTVPAMPIGASARTITFWIKPVWSAGDQTMVYIGDVNATAGGIVIMFNVANPPEQMFVQFDNVGSLTWTIPTGLIWNGSPHFVAFTSDGTSTASLWLDGGLLSNQAIGTLGTIAGWGMAIARWPNATNKNYDGVLDEFAIWNRVLTGNEILSLYNLGAGVLPVVQGPFYAQQQFPNMALKLQNQPGMLMLESGVYVPPANIAYVAERAVIPASTLVFSPATDCVAGHTLVLILGNTGNFVVQSINDSAGAAAWLIDDTRANASNAAVSICSGYLNTILHTTDTITVTLSGAGTARGGLLEEFSGLKNSSWVDWNANNVGADSTAMTTSSTPAATQNAILCIEGFCVQASGRTFDKDPSYSDFQTHQSDRMGGAYKIISTGGVQSAVADFSGAGTNWAGALQMYKGA